MMKDLFSSFFWGFVCVNSRSTQNAPVLTVSVPLVGRLGPDDVSDADVDWRMCREGRHLVGQKRLLHHRAKVVAVGAHFPVKTSGKWNTTYIK